MDYLTHHGIMEPALLYESPFTNICPEGPEGVFDPEQVGGLISVLEDIRATAAYQGRIKHLVYSPNC
ncbi:hypothetical protein NDI45_24510 [Leptolyngbya sp. GB1-A1]